MFFKPDSNDTATDDEYTIYLNNSFSYYYTGKSTNFPTSSTNVQLELSMVDPSSCPITKYTYCSMTIPSDGTYINGNTSSPMTWITTPPLQNTGTCYINNLNCNNINIPSDGTITREYVTSVTDVSYNVAGTRYRQHLTVPDCGIYMFSFSTGIFTCFPIYVSSDINRVYNSKTGSVNDSDGIDGIGGLGNLIVMDVSNMDAAWLILPNYGLKVYDGSTLRLNYYNRTSTPRYVQSNNDFTVDSCKVYYKGEEQIDYGYYGY